MDAHDVDLTTTLEVGAAFLGTVAGEESMVEVLAQLSRDDAIFYCARINAIVSGFAGTLTWLERQRAALSLLNLPEEAARIDAFCLSRRITALPAMFFRGQLLELACRVAVGSRNHPDEPKTFERKTVRSGFLRAALIASDLWSRRIFRGRLKTEGDSEVQLRRALGAFRKGTEEAHEAPHPGVMLGRTWRLFSRYLPARLPEFAELFYRKTGLTPEQYYACAFWLLKSTFVATSSQVIFPTKGAGAGAKIDGWFDKFIALKSLLDVPTAIQ